MPMDVGVVKIVYLDRPDKTVYDFLCAVAAEAFFGENWGGGWAGNTFVEFTSEDLNEKAAQWSSRRNLSAEEQHDLQGWIDDLPWDGDTIMLHLS